MTDGPADKEVGEAPGQGRIIEGPERLAEGDNFYNQFPFNEIFDSVSLAYALPKDPLRYALTLIARQELKPYFNDEDPNRRENRLSQILATRESLARVLPRHSSYKLGDSQNIPNLHSAMRRVVTELDQYPQWDQYIDDRMEALIGEYKADGTFFTRKKRPEMARSYLSWVQGRSARQQRITSLSQLAQKYSISEVLDETFPQDRTGASLGDVLPQTGNRSVNKRWRLSKSTEL